MLLIRNVTNKICACARSRDSQLFLNESENVKRSCLGNNSYISYLSLLRPLLQNLQTCPNGPKGHTSGSLCSAKHRPECELCTEQWRFLKNTKPSPNKPLLHCLCASLGRPTPALCSGSPCRTSGTCTQLKIIGI